MAIKTKDITITDGGQQKRFRVKQLPLAIAEKWILKLMLLIGGTVGGDVKEAIAKVKFEDIEPLYDQLFPCIEIYIPAGGTMPLMMEHVEDLPTLIQLRMEAFNINTDFLAGGALLNIRGAAPEVPADGGQSR